MDRPYIAILTKLQKKIYTYRWVNIVQHAQTQLQLQNTVNILNMHVLQAVPAFSKDRIPRDILYDDG
jgi:hypothetical protein